MENQIEKLASFSEKDKERLRLFGRLMKRLENLSNSERQELLRLQKDLSQELREIS